MTHSTALPTHDEQRSGIPTSSPPLPSLATASLSPHPLSFGNRSLR